MAGFKELWRRQADVLEILVQENEVHTTFYSV
jgi:hypothetical protein